MPFTQLLQVQNGFAITPSDSTLISAGTSGVLGPFLVYVGGAGDVTVLTAGGQTVTFSAVPVGTFLPVLVTRVNATGTGATLMLALK